MKRLVIQMLRLGDVLMVAPALQTLKERYPDDELHLLVNSDVKVAASVLPMVDEFHYFPRRHLQDLLVEPATPIFAGFDVLKDFTSKIQQIPFCEIYNFTQTRLSAYILGLLQAPLKQGMEYVGSGEFEIHGNWFQVLNLPENQMPYHFSEVFLRSVGGTGYLAPRFQAFDEKAKTVSSTLLLQPFSNEKKKMWSVEKWKACLQNFVDANRDLEKIEVLAAPFEIAAAKEFIHSLGQLDVPVEAFVCDLKTAVDKMQQSKLLITVDTSIKHLAAGTQIPIVEIALGSSQPSQTGVFRENSIIVSSRTNCYPCGHSDLCNQLSHLCGDFLNPNTVSEVATCLWKPIAELRSRRFFDNSGTRVSLPQVTESGSWVLNQMDQFKDTDVAEVVKKYLSTAFQESASLDFVGSRALQVVDVLKKLVPNEQWSPAIAYIDGQEKSCFEKVKAADHLNHRLLHLIRKASDNDEFDQISRELDRISAEKNMVGPPVFKNNIIDLRQLSSLRGRLHEYQLKINFEAKFYRTMKLQMESS